MENFWRVNKAGIAQTGSYCGLTQSFHWKSVAMCKSCQECAAAGDHMSYEDQKYDDFYYYEEKEEHHGKKGKGGRKEKGKDKEKDGNWW